MASAKWISEIYIATKLKVPDQLKIDNRTIAEIVERENRIGDEVVFRTVTDPAFHLTKIGSMDWKTESEFRKRPISVCIVDGKYFSKYIPEIYTIRAHFFPPTSRSKHFCITSPSLAATSGAKTDSEAVEHLENETFRCKLAVPNHAGFMSMLKGIKLIREVISSDRDDKARKLWLKKTFAIKD